MINLASLIVSTLEQNTSIVFLAVCVVFSCFLFLDYFRTTDPLTFMNLELAGVPVKTDNGDIHKGVKVSKRDDDEEPPTQAITSAIPENTQHIPYKPYNRSNSEMVIRSMEFYRLMDNRRTVRYFSSEAVPEEVLKNIIMTSGTSPSGAHTEPWSFILVQDPEVKSSIRNIVEEEEYNNYNQRMSRQWVKDLEPLKTTYQKPYLTEAPALLLIFRQTHSYKSDGSKRMHYYSEMSVGIASGILLAAIQFAGLVTLTSTPLNCGPKLSILLNRPSNERLALLLPIGRPHPDATVPDLQRKPFGEIAVCV